MRQRHGAASRPLCTLLACFLLLPVISGFDRQAPMGEAALPGGIPGPVGPPALILAPGAAAAAFSWRRQSEAAAPGRGEAPATTGPVPETVLDWETGAGRSHLIPALEVPGFLALLNGYDRIAYSGENEDGKKVYNSNLATTWEHLRDQNWVYDQDPFNINQFAHPYQGATMYGLARSSGLGFWESLAYSNAGSFLWKMAGETAPPSINDMITTGQSGSLLGEALFRMSQLVLKEGGSAPDGWHELGAALLSPPTGFNRLAFGDRFKTLYPSCDPATFWRIRLGASVSGNSQQNATADFQMSYGLPGKPGYAYQRPLDYFDFQIGGLTSESNPISYVLLRGLLYGKTYQAGDNYRGIWGVYGSYDFLSPTVFRVSDTALSLGSTGQYRLAHDLSLQGSILGGAGFGAAGVTPSASGERDYHYGLTPHALLSLRMILGHRAALELIGREYYVSGTGSDNARGSERITRINTGLMVRIYQRHGVGLQFIESMRDAHYGNRPGSHQSDGTVSLVYSFLGDSHFGAVEWPEGGN